MKTFSLALVGTILASASAVHAASTDKGMKLINRETFTLSLYTHNIVSCRPGLASNGHNYPGPTTLSFTLAPGNSWSGGHFFNSEYFQFSTASLGDFCGDFKKITDIPNSEPLPARVDRKIYQNNHLVAPDSGLKCLRTLREEMTITIEGVPFTSVTDFDIGYSTDTSICKN